MVVVGGISLTWPSARDIKHPSGLGAWSMVEVQLTGADWIDGLFEK
jgi:hypothetical protein